MIRVLHFLSQVGAPYFFEGLAEHADRSRFELAVCTLDGPGMIQERLARFGVPGFALGCTTRAGAALAIGRLVRLLRRERFDVLHTHLFEPSAVGQLAALLARTPCRVMTRWHSDLHIVLRRPVHVAIDRGTGRLAHRVIAISRYTRDVLVEQEGVRSERVQVIYPACPAPLAAEEGGEDRRVIAREFGLEGVTVVGMVARLAVVKNHTLVLEAMRRVLGRARAAKLLLIGEGPLRQELEAQARALGIADDVVFLGFRADIARLYRVIDILAHPVIEEAFGLAVIEAMMRGIPVIASHRGVAAEVIRQGENGLLVPCDDPGAVADAISALIDAPEVRRRLGDAGRTSVDGRFSLPAVTRAYERCYLEALGHVA